MSTTEELQVKLDYQGHTLSVPAGLFMHLLNCASNRASDAQAELEDQPLDWSSGYVDLEYANRKASIHHCMETVELARRIREFLKENAKPCR